MSREQGQIEKFDAALATSFRASLAYHRGELEKAKDSQAMAIAAVQTLARLVARDLYVLNQNCGIAFSRRAWLAEAGVRI